MKYFKLLISTLFTLNCLSCFGQSQGLESLSAFEFDSLLRFQCCENKDEFLKIKDEFVRRIKNKEALNVETATRLLERKHENANFFSEADVISFINELRNIDISYNSRLQLEIYYQILKNYRFDYDVKGKDSLLVPIFKIREQYYLEIIHFQDFNRILANTMREIGDTTMFLRFNADVIGDVMFADITVSDKPANVLDRRLSEKLFEIQKKAFWDRVDFYNRTGNKKALEQIRDSKDYLFAVLKGQPNFIISFNEILKRNNLEPIPEMNNSRNKE